jgi:hypothetical protein
MAKVKVKTIVITRLDGPIENSYDVVLGKWVETDLILKYWAKTAPSGGYYDSCHFRVLFEDGNTYSGTYRLRQHDAFLKDLLARHINKICEATCMGWNADDFLSKYDIPRVA